MDCYRIQDTGTMGNADPNQKQTIVAAGTSGDDSAADDQLGKAPPLKEFTDGWEEWKVNRNVD